MRVRGLRRDVASRDFEIFEVLEFFEGLDGGREKVYLRLVCS